MMIPKRNKSESQNAQNITVTVTGFAKLPNGETVIEGVDADGVAKRLALTTKGKAAENSRRRSIEDYQKGFRVPGGRILQLVPGSVVALKLAYEYTQEGVWRGRWLEVLAYSPEEAKRVHHNRLAILRLYENKPEKEGGQPQVSGRLYVLDEKAGPLASKEAVRRYVEQVLAQKQRPAFILRVVDNNEVKEARMLARSFYDPNTKSPMSADQVTSIVMSALSDLSRSVKGGRAEAIGAVSFPISPRMLEDEGKRQYFEWANKLFNRDIISEDGEVLGTEISAKDTTFVVSEGFINKMVVHDPFGPGLPPEKVGLDSKQEHAVHSVLEMGQPEPGNDDDADLADAANAMRNSFRKSSPGLSM